MGIKGYVVRWVGSGDGKRWCDSPSEAAAEAWGRSLSDRCSDVAIYRVHLDGREERLPSYEEALAMRPAVVLVCRDCGAEVERGQRCKAAGCVDPLAALEAAERRLLEAGGWTVAGRDVYGAERWTHPTWKGGAESLSTALTIERRRLAAKGGAFERVTCTACLSAYTHNDYPAAALPTVADVEPIAAAMTDTPPSIREPADADDRGPARTWGTWQAPPRRRRNIGREARIATGSGHKLHLKIDLDDSGAPCAIKAEVHKEGSVFRGMLDTICALASQGLQHGASIHEVASRLIGVRFEPDGAVEGHATVRECLSIVDLLGRMIEAEFPRDGGAP